jgi:hypothetical protein
VIYVASVGLGAFVGFLVTVGLGIVYPGVGHLLGGFIGGIIAGLVARGILGGSFAGLRARQCRRSSCGPRGSLAALCNGGT